MGWVEKIKGNCCASIEKEDIDDDELINLKKRLTFQNQPSKLNSNCNI